MWRAQLEPQMPVKPILPMHNNVFQNIVEFSKFYLCKNKEHNGRNIVRSKIHPKQDSLHNLALVNTYCK
jgi:hypothetical protein